MENAEMIPELIKIELKERKSLKKFFKVVKSLLKTVEGNPSLERVMVQVNSASITLTFTTSHLMLQHKITAGCLGKLNNTLYITKDVISEFVNKNIIEIEVRWDYVLFRLQDSKFALTPIKLTNNQIIVQKGESNLAYNVDTTNYPDISMLLEYFDVTDNHYTICMSAKYIQELAKLDDDVYISINLAEEGRPFIISHSNNKTKTILMPRRLDKIDYKERNLKIREKLK